MVCFWSFITKKKSPGKLFNLRFKGKTFDTILEVKVNISVRLVYSVKGSVHSIIFLVIIFGCISEVKGFYSDSR